MPPGPVTVVPEADRVADQDTVLAMAEDNVAGLLPVRAVMESVVGGPGMNAEAMMK